MTQPMFHDDPGRGRTIGFSFVVSIVIAFVLTAGFYRAHYISTVDNCRILLDDKINPNAASAASIERLPDIGEKLAQAILDYRQSFKGPGPAFKASQDMINIKGIGPKKLEKIKPHLRFQ